MPETKLLEIIDSCADIGVKAVQYTGGGEPLVHPAIKQAFRRTLDRGMELALVSNGMAMNDEVIELLRDAAWVRISVDAYNPQTYSLIRRVRTQFHDLMLDNISKLVNRKRSAIVGVGFVVNAENYTEIYEACRLFKGIGVDNFRISAAFTPKGLSYFDGIFDEAKRLAQKAKEELEDENFTVFNLFNDRISNLFHGSQDYDYCPMKELVPYIGADLNVYTCCMLAYNDLGFIGSLKEQTFSELWNSKQKREFFKSHDPRKLCRMPCMFEYKNEFINYCLKNDPRHTNYI
jgi:MoaA/NifB/PqqE/SkfB family radical SAM enzyme